MKCTLCGKEFKPDELYVVRLGMTYHLVVQECLDNKRGKVDEDTD